MSNKTLMGVTLAAVTLAFAVVPVASFAKKHHVECYKDGTSMKAKSAKACKKMGGTTTKPAEAGAPAAKPATTETPAS